MDVHKFVDYIDESRLGFPSEVLHDRYSYHHAPTLGGSDVGGSSTAIGYYSAISLVARHVLCFGINTQSVSLTYTPGTTTCQITWLTGSHDFVVGEWLTLQGYGSAPDTCDGHYKILTVTSSTQVTIEVPSTFAPSSVAAPALEDPYFMYTTGTFNFDTPVLTDYVQRTTRGYDAFTAVNVTRNTTNFKTGVSSGVFPRNGHLYATNSSMQHTPHLLSNMTYEAWIYVNTITTSYTRRIIYTSQNNGYNNWVDHNFFLNENGYLCLFKGPTIDATIVSDIPIPAAEWVHVAFTRKNGIYRLFINGVMQTATLDASNTTTRIHYNHPVIGAYAESLDGLINSVRMTTGIARYTGNFTPPLYVFTDTPGNGYFVSRGGRIARPHNNPAAGINAQHIYLSQRGILPVFSLVDHDVLPVGKRPVFAINYHGGEGVSSQAPRVGVCLLRPGAADTVARTFFCPLVSPETFYPPPESLSQGLTMVFLYSNAGFYLFFYRKDAPLSEIAGTYIGRMSARSPNEYPYTTDEELMTLRFGFSGVASQKMTSYSLSNTIGLLVPAASTPMYNMAYGSLFPLCLSTPQGDAALEVLSIGAVGDGKNGNLVMFAPPAPNRVYVLTCASTMTGGAASRDVYLTDTPTLVSTRSHNWRLSMTVTHQSMGMAVGFPGLYTSGTIVQSASQQAYPKPSYDVRLVDVTHKGVSKKAYRLNSSHTNTLVLLDPSEWEAAY